DRLRDLKRFVERLARRADAQLIALRLCFDGKRNGNLKVAPAAGPREFLRLAFGGGGPHEIGLLTQKLIRVNPFPRRNAELDITVIANGIERPQEDGSTNSQATGRDEGREPAAAESGEESRGGGAGFEGGRSIQGRHRHGSTAASLTARGSRAHVDRAKFILR